MSIFNEADLKNRVSRSSVGEPIRALIRDVIDSVTLVENDSYVGVANTGVTAAEYGTPYQHTTVLTFNVTDAITVADNAALADGYELYAFPTGRVIINSASLSVGISVAEDTTNTAAEAALGTTAASEANATVGAAGATCENISGPADTIHCDGSAERTSQLATPVLIASGGKVYLNVASTWGNTAGTDLTGDVFGTAIVNWSFTL